MSEQICAEIGRRPRTGGGRFGRGSLNGGGKHGEVLVNQAGRLRGQSGGRGGGQSGAGRVGTRAVSCHAAWRPSPEVLFVVDSPDGALDILHAEEALVKRQVVPHCVLDRRGK